MKTGRVRQKAKPPAEEQPPTPAQAPETALPGVVSGPAPLAAKAPPRTGLIVGILVGILACFALVMILLTIFRGGGAKEWIEVTQANGQWTTMTTVLGPQVAVQERWETDCLNKPDVAVRPATCILKNTNLYNDTVVDQYDEFAYNIYYEETYSQVYEARGTEFAAAELKADDWWQDNRHYVRQEELDKGTCQYTNYSIWVDDPQDSSQEVEVYLSECEVWDRVTVYERVYEQKRWCQCDVTTLVQVGQQRDSGSGQEIRWPNPSVPAGGRTEKAFSGQVTFRGGDYTFTTTTVDLSQYQSYLSEQYYIGLRDGKPVEVSRNPSKQ